MSKEYIREVLSSDAQALKRFVALERKVAGSHPFFYSTEMDSDVMTTIWKISFFPRYAIRVVRGIKWNAGCCALRRPDRPAISECQE
jgi:hypothetical protein